MSASPSAQRRWHPDTQYESSPGTLDRLGSAAESHLSRHRLLRQDPRFCTDARYAPAARRGGDYAQHDSRPRTTARRVDRDLRASSGNRRELRSCQELLQENKLRLLLIAFSGFQNTSVFGLVTGHADVVGQIGGETRRVHDRKVFSTPAFTACVHSANVEVPGP
jgi:hypothetical protein